MVTSVKVKGGSIVSFKTRYIKTRRNVNKNWTNVLIYKI